MQYNYSISLHRKASSFDYFCVLIFIIMVPRILFHPFSISYQSRKSVIFFSSLSIVKVDWGRKGSLVKQLCVRACRCAMKCISPSYIQRTK